jgi:hypothetical protein
LRRTRNIRTLTDHQEALVGSVIVGFGAGKTKSVRNGFHLERARRIETIAATAFKFMTKRFDAE